MTKYLFVLLGNVVLALGGFLYSGQADRIRREIHDTCDQQVNNKELHIVTFTCESEE